MSTLKFLSSRKIWIWDIYVCDKNNLLWYLRRSDVGHQTLSNLFPLFFVHSDPFLEHKPVSFFRSIYFSADKSNMGRENSIMSSIWSQCYLRQIREILLRNGRCVVQNLQTGRFQRILQGKRRPSMRVLSKRLWCGFSYSVAFKTLSYVMQKQYMLFNYKLSYWLIQLTADWLLVWTNYICTNKTTYLTCIKLQCMYTILKKNLQFRVHDI